MNLNMFIFSFLHFVLIFMRAGAYSTVSSTVASGRSFESVARFKNGFKSFAKLVKNEIPYSAVKSFATNTNSWLVQTISGDAKCQQGGETAGARTDCLKDSSTSSIRVFCNSTTAIVQEFDSTATCTGTADFTYVGGLGCFPSSYSSDSINAACISNPSTLPLPAGNWFTTIIYGDSSCNKENTFVGYKNQACLDLGSSFSIKYNHPKLYQYSSSDTCTGRSTSVDFSSLFGECENGNSLSLQYDYILSDGSSSGSGGQPTMKPTKKPTTKPTRSPTKKPTQKPTRKPTNKSLVVNDPSDGSDSSQTTPSESSSKPHHTSATLVAASVSLSVVVLAGLFVWYYKRNHENHEKYVPINGKEEIIVEIPEVL